MISSHTPLTRSSSPTTHPTHTLSLSCARSQMVKVYICKLSAQEIATDAFEMHEESMAEYDGGAVISLKATEVWYNTDEMNCISNDAYADLDDKSVCEKVLDIAQQYQLEETPLIKSKNSFVKIMKLYLKKVLATLETKPEKKKFRSAAQKFIMKIAGPDAGKLKDSNYSFYVKEGEAAWATGEAPLVVCEWVGGMFPVFHFFEAGVRIQKY